MASRNSIKFTTSFIINTILLGIIDYATYVIVKDPFSNKAVMPWFIMRYSLEILFFMYTIVIFILFYRNIEKYYNSTSCIYMGFMFLGISLIVTDVFGMLSYSTSYMDGMNNSMRNGNRDFYLGCNGFHILIIIINIISQIMYIYYERNILLDKYINESILIIARKPDIRIPRIICNIYPKSVKTDEEYNVLMWYIKNNISSPDTETLL